MPSSPLRYIASLDGEVSELEQAQTDQFEALAALVKDPGMASAPPNQFIGGSPVSWWLDLRGYYPPDIAREVTQPMLILQGERDYQVTLVDFQNWMDALSGRSDVEFKSYPTLNHLFIAGEGPSSPEEYRLTGNVLEEVIDDIASWIQP